MLSQLLCLSMSVASCAAPINPKITPLDVSGVDVPRMLLDHKIEFARPVDTSDNAVAASMHANKSALIAADYDKRLMSELMRLSDKSGRKITIHDTQYGGKNDGGKNERNQ